MLATPGDGVADAHAARLAAIPSAAQVPTRLLVVPARLMVRELGKGNAKGPCGRGGAALKSWPLRTLQNSRVVPLRTRELA